ncbi:MULTISPECIES: hypothetical protein [Microbacterium]|uniref:hypothetical protein n=1 Tax=Microbacterium TaxID=33882 RepID=UPI0028EF3CA5|nr:MULTISPECIES: hypothetical protein [Microbacterium]
MFTPVGLVATAVLVAAASPAQAAAEDSSDAASTIAEVAPEVLADAVPTVASGGEMTVAADETTTTFPASTDDAVLFEADGHAVQITLPAPDAANRADIAEGLVAYDNQDGTTTVPVVKADGSLQLTTIIDQAAAPTTYSYDLGLPEGYKLLRADEGEGIGIVSADETDLLGVFAAPWAVDANGRDVPTRYEIEGTALVQVVDHDADAYAYPIVADPWLGKDLYGTPSLTSWNGKFKVNVTPTQQGKDWAGVGTWWAHADEVKNKLAKRYPSRPANQRWDVNVQEQLYCHIAGLPFSLPEYNLEAARKFFHWETAALYKCNYPEGRFSG